MALLTAALGVLAAGCGSDPPSEAIAAETDPSVEHDATMHMESSDDPNHGASSTEQREHATEPSTADDASRPPETGEGRSEESASNSAAPSSSAAPSPSEAPFPSDGRGSNSTDGTTPERSDPASPPSTTGRPPPAGWPGGDFASGPGVHVATLEVDGRAREFTLFVSSTALDGGSQPLLFVLHGGGGNMNRMRNVGFEAHANRDGGFIVYPQGLDNRWADGRLDNSNVQEGIDDVGFLDHLVALLTHHLPVDEDRVGFTGASNGGMMSHLMACQSRSRPAIAAAVIASLPSDILDDCSPAHPPSILGIQGTADEFVTFEGGDVSHDRFPNLGEGGPIESAERTRAFWADRLGCGEPDRDLLEKLDPDDDTHVERLHHANCASGRSVDYYIVHGMGHAWPPFPPALPSVSGATSPQLVATDVIWSFLQANPAHP